MTTTTTATTDEKTLEQKVDEIHGFCMRLAETLDALGQNPMLAAMVPPGTFGAVE